MQTQTDERPRAMSGETTPENEERPPEKFAGLSVFGTVDDVPHVFSVPVHPDAPENRLVMLGDLLRLREQKELERGCNVNAERIDTTSEHSTLDTDERPPENCSGGSVFDYVDTETFVFPVSIRPDAPENQRVMLGDVAAFRELQKQAVCRDIEIMDDIVRARLRGYREEEMRTRGLPIDSPVAECGDERDEMPGLEPCLCSACNPKLGVITTGQTMGGMSFVQPAVSTTTPCTTTAESDQAFSFTLQDLAEDALHGHVERNNMSIPRSTLIETGYSEKAHRAYLDQQARQLRAKMVTMGMLPFDRPQHSDNKFLAHVFRDLPTSPDHVASSSSSDDDSIPDAVKPGAPEDISPSPPVHANEPVKKNLDSWDTSVLLDCNADDSEGQGRGVTYTYDEEGRPVPVVNVVNAGLTKTRWSTHLNSVFPVCSDSVKTDSEKRVRTDAVNEVCRGQPVTITTHDLKAMLLLSMAKASHFVTVREMNEVLKSEADWFNSGQSLTVYLPK
jgi:hypothetical protein